MASAKRGTAAARKGDFDVCGALVKNGGRIVARGAGNAIGCGWQAEIFSCPVRMALRGEWLVMWETGSGSAGWNLIAASLQQQLARAGG